MEAEPVPCHKDSKVLMSTQLPGTLRDFFDLFIASDSPFYEEVLVEQGNRWVRPHTSPHSATPPFTLRWCQSQQQAALGSCVLQIFVRMPVPVSCFV